MQQTTMTSPCGHPLNLLLVKTKEGIERRGVTTYEATVSFKELVANFPIEDNVLPEDLKRQREVDAARVNGIRKYWANSEAPVFPGMIMFANDIEIVRHHTIAGKSLIEAVLKPTSDRFIADGQGRTSFIKSLLETEQGVDFEDYTVSFKLVVTHTDDLICESAATVIRQLFSDLHCNLKKPSKSISKLFDTSTPLSRLQSAVLDFDVGGVKLSKRIALHGKLRTGQIWTFEQLCQCVSKLLGSPPAQLNKELADEKVYEGALALCKAFLTRVGAILPMHELDCEKYVEKHESLMFTKAIFCSALGYVGKSVLDEMILDETLTWEKALPSLPVQLLTPKEDKFWLTQKIVMNDEGRTKIIKGTEKRIAGLICRELRIYPCQELAA